jgi:hypothetical protein
MTYEFVIRDIKTKEDLYSIKKVPESRFKGVKESYEKALERKKKEDPRSDLVLLINKCDDEGNFEETVQ